MFVAPEGVMTEDNAPHRPTKHDRIAPAAASELNNLLQIISGTVAMLERIWEGGPEAGKYFDMLRKSVDRATSVTADLVQQIGGTDHKILLHPALLAAAKAKPAPLKVSRCIMVVDDEPMALALSRTFLTQAGYTVVTAHSGFEALDLFRKRPHGFALILLDLSMPLMDGEETFNHLRAIDPQAVVLLNTGFIEKHRLERLMAAGLAGFLRRPYRPGEVVAQIESVLERVPRRPAGVPA